MTEQRLHKRKRVIQHNSLTFVLVSVLKACKVRPQRPKYFVAVSTIVSAHS